MKKRTKPAPYKTIQPLYKHGLPFSETLAENLLLQKKRVFEQNKASLILIDGGVGEGKTTLGVHIADFLQGKPISFDEQLSMGGIDFIKKLKFCFKNELPVLLYDEAGDFNRRGSLTKFNNMLNRVFETFRAFKIIIVLILPSFDCLDNTLFDKKIPRMLINCYDRENFGNFRAYSLFRMFYIKDRMRRYVVKPAAYSYVRPNFRGHFLNLSPERSQELDKFSISGKFEILDDAQIKFDNLYSLADLSQKIGFSVSWIILRLKELNIEPVKVVRLKNYYDVFTLEKLASTIQGKSKEMLERMKPKPKKDA